MNRLAGLSNNRLVSDLMRIKADLDGYKNRQRTSGQSGVLSYFSKSGNIWDLTQAITGASFQLVDFTVTFTGDGSQQFPVVSPYIDLYVNGTDNAHRIPLDGSLYDDGSGNTALYSPGGNANPRAVFTPEAAYLADPLVSKWDIEIEISGNITYYLKAYAAGTCRGSITVVRTA